MKINNKIRKQISQKLKINMKESLPLFIIGICFCIGITLLIPKAFLPASSQNILNKSAGGSVVVIDAGHGGSDPGKIGVAGTKEKDINLIIALLLKNLLEAQDIQVVMTRDNDEELSTDFSRRKLSDMAERISLINKSNANVVVSIHQNSYTSPEIYGAQCFYYTHSAEGKELASLIQEQIISSTEQTKIREIKSNSDYYLLKHSDAPTVIVECGFLSNPEEEQLLLTKEYQEKMAWAIHLGILRYLNNTL